MEQDKQLKGILEKGAEKASANFTASVMAGVHALAAKPFVYEPLVPASVRRIFVIIFITLLALIFILCLLIAAPGIGFIYNIKLPDVTPETYQKIISGILIFWMVFAINNVLMKSKLNGSAIIRWLYCSGKPMLIQYLQVGISSDTGKRYGRSLRKDVLVVLLIFQFKQPFERSCRFRQNHIKH